MAKIGAFSKTEHGYKGRVRTLTVNTEVEIVYADDEGDKYSLVWQRPKRS